MATTSGVATKPVTYKFQGVTPKSRLHDEYAKIKDTDLGHIDLGEFLRVCNSLTKRSTLTSALIHSRLVNAVSHPGTVQSAELIMTLSQHFVPDERVVKSISGEVVLDLRPDDIERVFHLPRANQFIRLSYETAKRWYKDHHQEVIDTIYSSYFIKKPPRGKKVSKVNLAQGYMKDDIGYSIILLSRVMGLPVAGHLAPFMINFIKTIRHAKIPMDLATKLSENLCDQLKIAKDKKKFYMISYVVYLLVARVTNYLGLYKKGSIQDPNAWPYIVYP